MTTPWLKVLIDLWEHRGRTLVVALAIAVGVLRGGRGAERTRDPRSRVQAGPGGRRSWRLPSSAPRLLRADLPTASRGCRWLPRPKRAPSSTGRVLRPEARRRKSKSLSIPDFDKLTVDALIPARGAYPPGRRETLVEGASLESLQARGGRRDHRRTEQRRNAHADASSARSHDAQRFSPTLAGVGDACT